MDVQQWMTLAEELGASGTFRPFALALEAALAAGPSGELAWIAALAPHDRAALMLFLRRTCDEILTGTTPDLQAAHEGLGLTTAATGLQTWDAVELVACSIAAGRPGL